MQLASCVILYPLGSRSFARWAHFVKEKRKVHKKLLFARENFSRKQELRAKRGSDYPETRFTNFFRMRGFGPTTAKHSADNQVNYFVPSEVGFLVTCLVINA